MVSILNDTGYKSAFNEVTDVKGVLAADPGYHVTATGQTIAQKNLNYGAKQETIGRVGIDLLDQTIHKSAPQTALSTLTGRNYLQDASLKTSASNLTSGTSAGGNIDSARTGKQLKSQLGDTMRDFKADLKAAQQSVRNAMQQGAEGTPGINHDRAVNSFAPPANRSDAGMAMSLAAGSVYGFMAVTSAISEVKSSMKGNLSPAQEAQLADKMRNLLVPPIDPSTGEPQGDPAVANNFTPEAYKALAKMEPPELVKLFKEVMRPPEMQPEYIAIAAAQTKIGNALNTKVEKASEAVVAKASGSISAEAVKVGENTVSDVKKKVVNDGDGPSDTGVKASWAELPIAAVTVDNTETTRGPVTVKVAKPLVSMASIKETLASVPKPPPAPKYDNEPAPLAAVA